MSHLSANDIELLLEDGDGMPAALAHLAVCTDCAERWAQAQKLERGLYALSRIEPAIDLPDRIISSLPMGRAHTLGAGPWLGTATLIAALLGFSLALKTAIDLRTNGAFELVSYYTSQPEIVTTYPDQAWGAFSSAVPWISVTLSLSLLAATLFLMYYWAGTGFSSRTMRAETRA
jgi:hypothetical protein